VIFGNNPSEILGMSIYLIKYLVSFEVNFDSICDDKEYETFFNTLVFPKILQKISKRPRLFLFESSVGHIAKFLDLPEEFCELIQSYFYKMCLPSFETGSCRYNRLYAMNVVLKSNHIWLDDMLEGGIRQGEVFEICGSMAVGKSLLCLHFLSTSLSLKRKALYLQCGNNGFSMERLIEIMNETLSFSEILSQLRYLEVGRYFHLKDVLKLLNSHEEVVLSLISRHQGC